MKLMSINKKFTEKVAQYIAEGYVINSKSMTGHQGEEGKVDLYKDGTVVRVWLYRENAPWTRRSFREEWKGYTLYLRVGKLTVDPKTLNDTWTTYWMNDFEIVEESPFYQVDYNCDWYFDNLEEAMSYQIKKYDRARMAYYETADYDVTSPATQEICSKYLKRKWGYQRVRKADIVVRKYTNFYKMYYAGNYYFIQ